MKKYILFMLCLTITACGGGGGSGKNGSDGAPGKSAYELWLDAGNTGTEQDFLDSLVASNSTVVVPSQYASFLQEAQATGEYIITQIFWPEHGDYYRIEKNTTDNTNDNNTTNGGDSVLINSKITYNEKELNLANYGVLTSEKVSRTEFGNDLYKTYNVGAWINNREGIGANVYTPMENTVFSGSTMAYLYDEPYALTSTMAPVFIKGDAIYTYSATNPKLILDFDNYYRFVFQNDVNAQMTGTNNTGNDRYNLSVGGAWGYFNNVVPTDVNLGDIGFVKKDDTEEVVGKYNIIFQDYAGYEIYAPNGYFKMVGAFGATKQ